MSYCIVQFAASEGGNVAVVVKKWLTPKKKELFWPPTKDPKVYDKLLQRCSSPNERWSLYEVDRLFYETDQLEKAKKKLKLVETTSDIQTDEETNTTTKRQIKKNNKYNNSSSEGEDESGLTRPPPLKKLISTSHYLTPSSSNGEKLHDSQMPQSIDPVNGDHDETDTDALYNDNAPLGSPEPCSRIHTDVCKNSKCGSQDKIVSLLAHVKAQNDTILSILQERDTHTKHTLNPDFKFPLKTLEEMEVAEKLLNVEENYANLVAYFRCLGGQGVNNKVSRVMRAALSDSLATKYNFYGKRSDKKPFADLRLRASVVESLKSATITAKNIEDSIKGWVKHAPDRAKKALNNSPELSVRSPERLARAEIGSEKRLR